MDSETNTRKERGKKILSWAVTAVCILFLLLALFLLCVSHLANRDNRQTVDVFGYSFSVVQTDSMSPEIGKDELLTVKKCGIEEAAVGKNAVYIATDGVLAGKQIVHKVIRTGSDERGAYIVTQGLKAGAPEDEPVYADSFVGLAVSHSVFWGKIAKFFSTPVNWALILVVLIGLPAVCALTKSVIRFSREAKKEKKEEQEKSGAEREKLKEELLREYSENTQEKKEDGHGE